MFDSVYISLLSFVFIFGGSVVGHFLSRKLPPRYFTPESKEAVKMTWGIIATMTALVLGLMIASAKSSFDAVNNETTLTSAKLIMLNNVLRRYGPQADDVRQDLKATVASALKRDWPDEQIDSDVPAAAPNSNVIEIFETKLDGLVPVNDTQRALLTEAQAIAGDLSLERWEIIEQSQISLPTMLFVSVVFWLTLLFMGLSLFAPQNSMTLVASLLGAISVCVAIFVVSDMSHPTEGLICISSSSRLDVWHHMQQ
jgi:hypothetical protein